MQQTCLSRVLALLGHRQVRKEDNQRLEDRLGALPARRVREDRQRDLQLADPQARHAEDVRVHSEFTGSPAHRPQTYNRVWSHTFASQSLTSQAPEFEPD